MNLGISLDANCIRRSGSAADAKPRFGLIKPIVDRGAQRATDHHERAPPIIGVMYLAIKPFASEKAIIQEGQLCKLLGFLSTKK